ncbi:MAG TPA: AI-2E family transporter, partial [Phnomibacter sp.]|nr:AI-2E family transporter [Phnomibacter sp.]
MDQPYRPIIHPNQIRQILLLITVIGLGVLLWVEMYFMLTGFLGAVAMYVVMRRPMMYLVFKKNWKRWIAALMLMIISLFVIIYPFAWIFNLLIAKLGPVIADTNNLQESLKQMDRYLHDRYGFDLLTQSNIEKMADIATNIGTKVVTTTLSTITNLFVMYFILWFMLMKVGSIQRWVRQALPVRRANADKVLREMREMIMSNSIGIPV